MEYRFEFSSNLPEEYAEDVESLLFFNPQQAGARDSILRSMAEYGQPRISIQDETVTVKVGDLEDVQALFALAEADESYELAGLVLYVRTDIDNVLVLHIAVTERFSATGADRDAMLVMRLVNTVRYVARRLKGVRSVTVMYSPVGPPLKLALRE